MDKEVVVHIHSGILLSHKKECIRDIFSVGGGVSTVKVVALEVIVALVAFSGKTKGSF